MNTCAIESGNPLGGFADRTAHAVSGQAESATASIRLLFIIDQLTVLGGGERAMIQMIRGLSSRFDCRVVTFRETIHPEAAAALNVPITIVPVRSTFSRAGILAALRLSRWIRRERIDIAHTFFETSDLFGGFAAWMAGVPAIISSRRDMGLLRSTKHRIAYRLAARIFSRVLAVSNAVGAEAITNDRIDPQKVTTLYTAVRMPERVSPFALDTMRERLHIPAGAPVVLTVANLLPWKGHFDFLSAASRVRRRIPDAYFLVAGAPNDAALLEALRKKRDALRMSNCFHFLGEVRPATPLYQLASVFCLLSSTEGLPNVVLESMAAGLPVVATRVGGTSELIVHGQTGFLVGQGRPDEAAENICAILGSPEQARRMSEAAKMRVREQFSMPTMIQSLEAIYDACLTR